MARTEHASAIVEAIVSELVRQGQGGRPEGDPMRLTSYPIKGTIDVLALAQAVESAVGGANENKDDGKAPAELNAANDG